MVSIMTLIYNMFYTKMVNYCATYFILVQTKIEMLNFYLQGEYLFDETNKVDALLKEIAVEYEIAIE